MNQQKIIFSSPYRGRSRSDSRDRMRRSIDRGSVDRVGRSNYYRPNIDLDDMTSQLFADQNMSYADFLTSRAPGKFIFVFFYDFNLIL